MDNEQLLKLSDLDILALTVYGEARNQPIEGQVAVANVILNRLESRQWGSDIKSVCLARKQFSCWNENDPNRKILEAMATKLSEGIPFKDKVFNRVFFLCSGVYRKILEDITQGCLNYMTLKLFYSGLKPSWASEHNIEYRLIKGDHIFLRLKG